MDIFVGSLPFKLKETELKEAFEKYGVVTSVTIIIDKITRQNKGFGFVVMPDAGEAHQAIKALNGTEMHGRKILASQSEGNKNTGTRNKGEGNNRSGRGSEKNRRQ